jgi:thioredoxin-related protein
MKIPGPAVVVFVQEGCSACEEFLPRFKQRVEGYRRCGVKVYAPDVARDAAAEKAAQGYGIRATPTMLIISPKGRVWKFEGALADEEMDKAFGKIVCDVP